MEPVAKDAVFIGDGREKLMPICTGPAESGNVGHEFGYASDAEKFQERIWL
jgi:hypothetical protein